jgi:hypothetical protein
MSSPTGPDENQPPGAAPQGGQPGWSAPQGGQPGWSAPQGGQAAWSPPPQPGYGPEGYTSPGYPAPAYSGGPATGPRPGTVSAAAIIGIIWGALGALVGLLLMFAAFALGAALFGLLLLVSTALSAVLLVAGVQVLQGRSPRLLLLLSYVAIGLSVLSLVVSSIGTDGSLFNGILGVVIPGVIVYLLLQPRTKEYYAARGITY